MDEKIEALQKEIESLQKANSEQLEKLTELANLTNYLARIVEGHEIKLREL